MSTPIKDFGLIDRDIRILKMLGLGMTVKQIAGELGISEKTVEWHISGTDNPRSISAKLGQTSRAGMVRFAVERGLVKPGEKPPGNEKPKEPVIELKGVNDLAAAVMHAASLAAAKQADPVQVSSLCQTVGAVIDLARLEFEAADRNMTLPEWLRKK